MRAYTLLFVVAAAYFVACANGFPAMDMSDESDEKPNTGTVLVLPGRTFADDDSIEEPSSWWRSSTSLFDTSGFSYVMRAMQQAMSQWRREMMEITKRLREQGIGVGPLTKIPEGANTTSTTKVIDGHVVTINETTYSDGDDSQGTVIRVRVIDIKPQNETIPTTDEEVEGTSTTLASTTIASTTNGESEQEGTTPGRSVETVEDFDNEIPKNQGDLTA